MPEFTPNKNEKEPEVIFDEAKITEADIDEFLRLEVAAAASKLYSATLRREDVKKEIENNEVYFIKLDGTIIGHTEYQLVNENEAYLGGLVIDPQFQGQGIARKAIEFRLEKLKDVKKVYLVTHPLNSKIIHLYESYGFTIRERKENYFGDGEPRVILVREKLEDERLIPKNYLP